MWRPQLHIRLGKKLGEVLEDCQDCSREVAEEHVSMKWLLVYCFIIIVRSFWKKLNT